MFRQIKTVEKLTDFYIYDKMLNVGCDREAKRFLVRCFTVTQICLLISFIVWLIVLLVSDLNSKVQKYPIPWICCLFAALLLIVGMVVMSSIKSSKMAGQVLSIIVAILILVGACLVVSPFDIVAFIISFVLAELLFVVCILTAIYCQCDLTVYVIYLVLLMLVAFLAGVMFVNSVIPSAAGEMIILETTLLSFIIFIIVILMIFTAQALQGGYFIEVEQFSYIKSGCCFYIHCAVLFLMLLILNSVIRKMIIGKGNGNKDDAEAKPKPNNNN